MYDLFIAMEIMLPWQQRNIFSIVLLDGLINKLFLTKSCAEIIASGASCYRIEIELLLFKFCPALFGQSFSKLSSGCSSEQKSKSSGDAVPSRMLTVY